ncbi:hypothetical protein [uncultured Jannaschia sp.]|uniref:hypothetical protein n=1 Tax=uncultured Jannaschia sp. TaxID=293347 RepID=UPI00261C28ED|nr:hypothetical protein [uncultured Jannaschia sp.]
MSHAVASAQAAEAEHLSTNAINHDPSLFTTNDDLIPARAVRRGFALCVVSMRQEARAQPLHTAALTATRQGDFDAGCVLRADAIGTHPRQFEATARALRALDV